jgi:6-phosphogluconolactonase
MNWNKEHMLTRRGFGALTAGAIGQLMAAEKESLVYIGTYTRDGSKGIYVYRFNPSTGKLAQAGLAAESPNPSFLHVTPNGRYLYAVGENEGGIVRAFAVDGKSGKLALLNEQKSGGNGPCHLAADSSDRVLAVAHYGSGSVAAFPLESDGRIGERSALVQHSGSSANQKRQAGPHAHSVNFSKSGKYVVAADLGLDQFLVYAVDDKGALTQHSVAKVTPGSGPRHFSFHPGYKSAYGVNELSNTVTGFSWDESAGKLTEIQTITTLPADFSGTSYCAEILVHPSGKFVYASNRGHDSIAGFSVGSDGKLTSSGATSTQGKNPRNFRISPSGDWLIAANQDGGNLVVFRIDSTSGKLTPTGEEAKLPFPVCIRFV